MPVTAASNSGSIRPSPRLMAKSFACPPWNSTPSMRPLKSTMTRSPAAAGTARRRVGGALLAQHLDRVVDVGRPDLGHRPGDRRRREVADADLGIHLEHGRELELVLAARRRLLRLDPRIAGDAQVLVADRVVERRLHGVGDDVGAHLRARTAGRPSSSAPCPGRKPGTLTFFASRARRLATSLSIAASGTATLRRRSSWPRVSRLVCMCVESLLDCLRWCERGDSNPHGLPRWNLNPVRLPIPPLSQPLSPNGLV